MEWSPWSPKPTCPHKSKCFLSSLLFLLFFFCGPSLRLPLLLLLMLLKHSSKNIKTYQNCVERISHAIWYSPQFKVTFEPPRKTNLEDANSAKRTSEPPKQCPFCSSPLLHTLRNGITPSSSVGQPKRAATVLRSFWDVSKPLQGCLCSLLLLLRPTIAHSLARSPASARVGENIMC